MTDDPAVDATTRAGAVAEARRLILEQGLSGNQAAARVAGPLGVSGRSVARWAAAFGQPLGQLSRDSQKTRAATEAWRVRGGYTAVRRLALCDRILAVIERHLEGAEPEQLRALTIAFAVASDKRDALEGRLEDEDEAEAGEQDGRLPDLAVLRNGRAPLAARMAAAAALADAAWGPAPDAGDLEDDPPGPS